MTKKKSQKRKPSIDPVNIDAPPLSPQEVAQYGGGKGPVNVGALNCGDEINVIVRGRVVEVGNEMSTIDLVELYQQGRVAKPIFMTIPTAEIRSAPLPYEGMPGEDPNQPPAKGEVGEVHE